MVIIFCFSHQISDDSSRTSGNTIRAILNVFMEFREMSEEQKEEIVGFLQPIARKLAHFTIYAIGGIIIILYFNEYACNDVKKIMFSGLLGCSYSIFDEIHQMFIPRESRNVN